LKKDGVVTTSSAGLQATYVIHVQFQDTLAGWRNKMVYCLEEANRKLIKSVAFPILGAGKILFMNFVFSYSSSR
jgi:O-acetyl-ADP-ribose deacetylase (regulator of RNase III)